MYKRIYVGSIWRYKYSKDELLKITTIESDGYADGEAVYITGASCGMTVAYSKDAIFSNFDQVFDTELGKLLYE
jgi:hypothetical protein